MSGTDEKKISERLQVSNDEALIAAAMDESERFVGELSLDEKTALHIRLLTEEILEMVKSMVQEFTAEYHLEAENGECRICLEADADINLAREKDLMSASKDGKNILVKGFTAKLARFMTHHKEYINNLISAGDTYFANMPVDYLCVREAGGYIAPSELMWSMRDYRNYLYDDSQEAEEVEEKRDELEKSIVASIADDVKVGVKGDHITLIVVKKI